MKVLHINTYDTGGAAKACLRLHTALLNEDVESKVLVRNKSLDTPKVYEIWEELNTIRKGKKFLEQKKWDRMQTKIIDELGHTGELFSFPESIWDITAHPLYDWADIIHLHWVAGFVDWSTFFPRNTKKIVWTLHDEEPFLGGFHYPPMESVSPYLNLIEEHLVIKKKALTNTEITVVSPSTFLSARSAESMLFSAYQHHVIKNCTNTKAFKFIDQKLARKELNLPLDKKIVLFVADDMNYPRKGLPILLNALRTEDDLILSTVGKGSIGESENSIHYGRVESEERMNLIYASADLFVIPSLMDNLPNTIAESLCSGTPVVGFNVGGIPEMVDTECGIVCDKSSVNLKEEIRNALKKNWSNEVLAQQAVQTYSPVLCAQKYKAIYSDQ